MNNLLRWDAEEGQGLVEYALIIVLISLAVIVMLATLGGGIVSVYQNQIVGSLTSIGF